MTITGDFECFRYCTFHYITFDLLFRVNENLFQKIGVPYFLVEHTATENLIFPNKTALQKANVIDKLNGKCKRTYHGERSFVTNLFFLKI